MTEQTPTISEQASAGVRARRAFMPKHFIPNADWINVNVVAKGKGTQATLGRVFGIATSYEVKNNTLPNGDASSSIALYGAFETENYLTGELASMTAAYLPASYSERVRAVFDSEDSTRAVELDCDVGLEATGKTIPYEWVITAYREGEEMAVLKRLRGSRGRPAGAPALAAPTTQPALSAPVVDQTQVIDAVAEPKNTVTKK